MKKSILYLSLLGILLPGFSFSQGFGRKDKVASFAVGVGSSLGSFDYSSQMPALSLMYEQGIAQAGDVGIISLGGYLGYKAFSYETSAASITAKSKWNYTIVGFRGAFHFSQIQNEKLDLYGGLLASYNLLNYSYEDNSGSSTEGGNFGNSTGLTIFGGARYFFSDQLAGFAELGYGIAYLNFGASVRF